MLHLMLERGEPVHSAVWFDTGWEFPGMAEHIDLVERKTGVKVVRLRPEPGFEHWMLTHPVKARSGPRKGQVHRIGYGWPHATRRWCTRIKVAALDRYQRSVENSVACVGLAADEGHRAVRRNFARKKIPVRFPLIEAGMTEAQALELCHKLGYTWGGLYSVFRRVSCFCCPLQSLSELRKLRVHFPALWARMQDLDARQPAHNQGFHHYASILELDRRFAAEECGAARGQAA